MNVIGKNDTKVLNLQKNTYLPLLILLITFVSTNQWSDIPIGNTTIVWIIDFLTIICVLWYKKIYPPSNNIKDYHIIHIYFLWMGFNVIRGGFVAENYWEWKQLIRGSLALSLPIFIYVFSNPNILQETLHIWIKIAIPVFALFFCWIISADAYHFYLGPVLLLSCFIPILSKRWKIIMLFFLLLMIFADFTARSQVIKAAIVLMISGAYLMDKYISNRVFHIIYWVCYIAPILLLFGGITGTFNIFEVFQKKTEKVNIYQINPSIGDDSRTFIYEEVIISAIKNNYIWQGRTPARGNDSHSFGEHMALELKTGKYERHSNELCHTSVFTWLGLIGLILYSLIYFKSSYLAVYKSNNLWIKLLGIYIAFRWAYGWIEDFNSFDIMNISLWMMIAMGFSERFRKMNNLEFRKWVVNIFSSKKKSNK